MLIGYARVSTADQTLDLQKDALQQVDCTKIFTDTASGAKAERTGLNEALNYVRTGYARVSTADQTLDLQKTPWKRQAVPRSSPIPHPERRQSAILYMPFVVIKNRAVPLDPT
jgi:DNA invertase Pin-like site-specific DNA recombinase